MRTKDARLDENDKKENEFATKKASFSQDELRKQDWHPQHKQTQSDVSKQKATNR